ncbi:WD-repeat protein [Methylophaga frappieri]|uniref:WD-repeat protein n=1 Tax=Methylophaga frappieri (strain ATCC BAA-2434 / DSM 25690 / JAM7) TaxID=754477 RepID=I1YEI8_METFJ|nr:hypothetical protein [Methylophaga frappieri]AFJ01331.1 WD-repeat protein [Methylophaga frappieri]
MALMQYRIGFVILMVTVLAGCDASQQDLLQWRHSSDSYHAVFSADNRYLLTADTRAGARLWDRQNNSLKFEWQNAAADADGTQVVAIAADAARAVTVERETVLVWDMVSGQPLHRLTFPIRVTAAAIAPDGSHLLLALADRRAIYFDIAENQVRHRFIHDGKAVNSTVDLPISAVAISPDGKLALTGGDDFTARLWDLQTGQQQFSWRHENRVNLVYFDPQSRFVVTGGESEQVVLRHLTTGESLTELRLSAWPAQWSLPAFPVFDYTTTAVNISTDGQLLVTGHSNEKVCVWHIPAGTKVSCWKLRRQNALQPGIIVQAVAFSEQGDQLIAVGSDGITQQWRWQE